MALDRRDHVFCSDSFSADGIWERKGKALCGPAEILKELDDRSVSRRTLHTIANLVATATSAETVQVEYYLIAYDANDTGQGKTPVARFAGARVCLDELVKQDDSAWKIRRKSSSPLMTGV